MGDVDKHSRLNKFEKRRKNTKSISILLIIGGILIIVLLGMWVFGGDSEEETDEPNEQSSDSAEPDENMEDDSASDGSNDTQNETPDEGSEEETNDQHSEETGEDEENIETEQVEPSDGNVSEAYTGNWEPVGTEQEGPHTTNYNGGSQDRIEIDIAASIATGLNADDMHTHWVGNGGDQKVIATVGNGDQSAYYRVFISWIDNEGWQPTKVEELNELEY